ncbi:MAG: HRDC domain-containing protein [Caldilineaceae bacterium]|nr:HRDC domain-containing protein [Caldilineaceae bacterium]
MTPDKQKTALRKLTNPTLVYTKKAFARMIETLQARTVIALDTESDSLYSYYPKVCLIQITSYADPDQPDADQVIDFLLDPLRLADIGELGTLLADPQIEIILHAADNDILILQRDFDFTFRNIYDTQLAARILGTRRAGLNAILAENFGLTIDKRMQRTNWGKRPLTAQQLTYAQMDTHYLLALRERQIQALKEAKRWEEAQEAFSHLERIDYHQRPHPERTFWQTKAARSVDRKRTNVLEAVWAWREKEAQQQNRPPFKIVSDRVLERLAMQTPENQAQLAKIAGLSDYQLRRYGKAMLAAVAEGKQQPLPKPPESAPRHTLDKATQARYEALRNWRSKTARARGVDTDIVFNNSTLLAIAKRRPHSAAELEEIVEIGPWKAKTYAPDILPLVNGRA